LFFNGEFSGFEGEYVLWILDKFEELEEERIVLDPEVESERWMEGEMLPEC